MELTKALIDKCHELFFDSLSKEVVLRVKDLLKDFIGVSIRGAAEPSSIAMNQVVKSFDQTSDKMPVPGTGFSVHPAMAALSLGTAAHSIELDDVVNESSLHPAVAIIPAALSAAHMSKCPGRRFIEGIVVGYEVMSRLGIALNPTDHYARGFHPTGTCGTMGAAVAAAKILGLNKKGMMNAIGIAGSQAAGSMEFLSDGSMTKRLHPGWAAHSGVMAALMAREDFSGPNSIIEGRFGFLHAYSTGSKADKVLDGWGNPFQVMRTSFKPHACCRYMQGPIDAILKIMKTEKLTDTDIKRVTVGVLKTGFPIVVDPIETKRNPKSIVDAQFSMPFGAAVAIAYKKAFIDEFTMENIRSKKIRTIMDKVDCISYPELEEEFPKKWKAKVTIETKSDAKISERIVYPKGDPENPLTPAELDDKFRSLISDACSNEKVDFISTGINGLDHHPNIRIFIQDLCSDIKTNPTEKLNE